MNKLEVCRECGTKFKHHELVHHRRPKLVFIGYTEEGLEDYRWHRCGADFPLNSTLDHIGRKKIKQELPSSVSRRNRKAARKSMKTKYVRPKDQPRTEFFTECRRSEPQVWRKEPRRAYCTGCGFTFTHMHLLRQHRDREKCGGRFLPPAERDMINKLRLERERQLRADRFFNNLNC